MKKNTAIVFGISDNYVFALANVLIGMKKHCKLFWDDIIVYHTGLKKSDIDNLNKIIKCKFIDFNDLAKRIVVNDEVIKEYSLLTFARFECFNLLKDYHNVIWQDVDILVQKDFSSLIDYCEEYGFSATQSVDGFYVESNFNKILDNYDMFQPLYNAGILCLNDKLENYEIMSEWCYKATEKYSKFIRFADQGIINLLIQEFKINVGSIDILNYCCHPTKDEASNATIVHAYGHEKFWNYEEYKSLFPEWFENNNEWSIISNSTNTINIKSKPLVSVVMSVFNRYDYLEEALNSIINQSYKNLEIIIVVEKSSIQKEIDDFISKFKDKRIVVINNERKLGFPESLNVGIKASSGKYIARMDDDDICILDRIEKQVAFLETNQKIDIVGSWMQMFMKCNDLCTCAKDDTTLKIQCIYMNPFFHPTIMMRKDSLEKYNLYYDSEYFTEDYELWCRATKYVKFANIQEVLLKYRASGQNSTIQHGMKVHDSIIKVMKKQLKENIDLTLTNNELELLYGKQTGLFNSLFNLNEANEMLNQIYLKIIEANKLKNFYDQSMLEELLGLTIVNNNNSHLLLVIPKKIIKFIFKPIYSRLMNRIEQLIDLKIDQNNRTLLFKVKNMIKNKKDE